MSKNESTKSAGALMIAAIKRRARPCTTAELAEVAGLSVKDAYSRLWWLQKKDGVLKSTGKGKERLWQFTARALREIENPEPAAEG